MNNLPLVSIVVPCYNHERYIKKTIVSIMNQTYDNIELIVVDDGSQDNSVKIINDLNEKYNFKFFPQKNKGLIKTLNNTIENYTKGKYICCVASDDYFHEEKIEKQVSFLEDNNHYQMCYTNVITIDNDNNFIERISSKRYKSGDLFELIYSGKMYIPAPSVMFTRNIYNKVNGYSTEYKIEDLAMWLKISLQTKIGHIDEYLTYYRLHDNNTHKKTVFMIKETEKILLSFINEKEYCKKYMGKWYLKWFGYLCIENKKEAKYYLRKSLRNFYNYKFIKSFFRYLFIK